MRSPLQMNDLFLNYYNLKQVFFLEGETAEVNIEKLFTAVRACNPSAKISISYTQERTPQSNDIFNEVRLLGERSMRFKKYLQSLKFPLAYSMLMLLSQGKVSLFNDNLVKLMEYLVESQIWNQNIHKAELAAFIIE